MGKCFVWAWFRQTCTRVYSLPCGKDTKFKLPKAGNGTVFFLDNWVIFAKADKAVALQTVPLLPKEVLTSSLSVDEHKHSPSRMHCFDNFCRLLRTELQTDAAPILLWFVRCQNSATSELAPLGMRGLHELD